MPRLFFRLRFLQLLLLSLITPCLFAAEGTDDAKASFNYISSTLQTYRGNGSLANNPGIEESDLEQFIALLENAYQSFSADFNSDSAMCRFYRDPENGRMTIEERAELSVFYLRSLDSRLELFDRVNREFQEAVVEQFGSIVLDNINATKLNSRSSERLPASTFDEAATIGFLDAMCS